jgi:predicted TIM-barrel fold metal-dependent hydrolase
VTGAGAPVPDGPSAERAAIFHATARRTYHL